MRQSKHTRHAKQTKPRTLRQSRQCPPSARFQRSGLGREPAVRAAHIPAHLLRDCPMIAAFEHMTSDPLEVGRTTTPNTTTSSEHAHSSTRPQKRPCPHAISARRSKRKPPTCPPPTSLVRCSPYKKVFFETSVTLPRVG